MYLQLAMCPLVERKHKIQSRSDLSGRQFELPFPSLRSHRPELWKRCAAHRLLMVRASAAGAREGWGNEGLLDDLRQVLRAELLPGRPCAVVDALLPPSDLSLMDTAVRGFSRSAAGGGVGWEQSPDAIRTPSALLRTMDYMFDHVADMDLDGPDPRFADDDDRSRRTARSCTAAEVQRFLAERLRAVSKDYVQLGFRRGGRNDAIVLETLERGVRHLISDLYEGSETSTRVAEGSQQLHKLLHDFLKSLLELYSDAASRADMARRAGCEPLRSPHEAECTAYSLLLSAAGSRDLESLQTLLERMSPELLASAPVRFALHVRGVLATGHASAFFRLFDEADYFQACLLAQLVPLVRHQAVIQLCYSLPGQHRSLPAERLFDILRMSAWEDLVALCAHYSLDLRHVPTSGWIVEIPARGHLPPRSPLPPRREPRLVRDVLLPELVDRCDAREQLPPLPSKAGETSLPGGFRHPHLADVSVAPPPAALAEPVRRLWPDGRPTLGLRRRDVANVRRWASRALRRMPSYSFGDLVVSPASRAEAMAPAGGGIVQLLHIHEALGWGASDWNPEDLSSSLAGSSSISAAAAIAAQDRRRLEALQKLELEQQQQKQALLQQKQQLLEQQHKEEAEAAARRKKQKDQESLREQQRELKRLAKEDEEKVRRATERAEALRAAQRQEEEEEDRQRETPQNTLPSTIQPLPTSSAAAAPGFPGDASSKEAEGVISPIAAVVDDEVLERWRSECADAARLVFGAREQVRLVHRCLVGWAETAALQASRRRSAGRRARRLALQRLVRSCVTRWRAALVNRRAVMAAEKDHFSHHLRPRHSHRSLPALPFGIPLWSAAAALGETVPGSAKRGDPDSPFDDAAQGLCRSLAQVCRPGFAGPMAHAKVAVLVGFPVAATGGLPALLEAWIARGMQSPYEKSTPPHQKSTPPHQKSTPPHQKSTPPHQKSTPPHQKSTLRLDVASESVAVAVRAMSGSDSAAEAAKAVQLLRGARVLVVPLALQRSAAGLRGAWEATRARLHRALAPLRPSGGVSLIVAVAVAPAALVSVGTESVWPDTSHKPLALHSHLLPHDGQSVRAEHGEKRPVSSDGLSDAEAELVASALGLDRFDGDDISSFAVVGIQRDDPSNNNHLDSDHELGLRPSSLPSSLVVLQSLRAAQLSSTRLHDALQWAIRSAQDARPTPSPRLEQVLSLCLDECTPFRRGNGPLAGAATASAVIATARVAARILCGPLVGMSAFQSRPPELHEDEPLRMGISEATTKTSTTLRVGDDETTSKSTTLRVGDDETTSKSTSLRVGDDETTSKSTSLRDDEMAANYSSNDSSRKRPRSPSADVLSGAASVKRARGGNGAIATGVVDEGVWDVPGVGRARSAMAVADAILDQMEVVQESLLGLWSRSLGSREVEAVAESAETTDSIALVALQIVDWAARLDHSPRLSASALLVTVLEHDDDSPEYVSLADEHPAGMAGARVVATWLHQLHDEVMISAHADDHLLDTATPFDAAVAAAALSPPPLPDRSVRPPWDLALGAAVAASLQSAVAHFGNPAIPWPPAATDAVAFAADHEAPDLAAEVVAAVEDNPLLATVPLALPTDPRSPGNAPTPQPDALTLAKRAIQQARAERGLQ